MELKNVFKHSKVLESVQEVNSKRRQRSQNSDSSPFSDAVKYSQGNAQCWQSLHQQMVKMGKVLKGGAQRGLKNRTSSWSKYLNIYVYESVPEIPEICSCIVMMAFTAKRSKIIIMSLFI